MLKSVLMAIAGVYLAVFAGGAAFIFSWVIRFGQYRVYEPVPWILYTEFGGSVFFCLFGLACAILAVKLKEG